MLPLEASEEINARDAMNFDDFLSIQFADAFLNIFRWNNQLGGWSETDVFERKALSGTNYEPVPIRPRRDLHHFFTESESQTFVIFLRCRWDERTKLWVSGRGDCFSCVRYGDFKLQSSISREFQGASHFYSSTEQWSGFEFHRLQRALHDIQLPLKKISLNEGGAEGKNSSKSNDKSSARQASRIFNYQAVIGVFVILIGGLLFRFLSEFLYKIDESYWYITLAAIPGLLATALMLHGFVLRVLGIWNIWPNLTSFDRRSENVLIRPVIIAELELGNGLI